MKRVAVVGSKADAFGLPSVPIYEMSLTDVRSATDVRTEGHPRADRLARLNDYHARIIALMG
jgi:hypothetical protein